MPDTGPLPTTAIPAACDTPEAQPAGSMQEMPNGAQDPVTILLETSPDSRSFVFRYILACVPVLLVILCIFVRALLTGVTQAILPGIPGSLGSLVPSVSGIATLSIYLVAPVGVFIVVAAIGWTLRLTELWTGTAIALAASIAGGMIMLAGSGLAFLSERYIFDLVQWIAFFVQPVSILAAIAVIAWTEKFRKSLRYTITTGYISIKGGVWKNQEHLIPHNQIARVVLEQDLFGRLFNYGTVIPQSMTRWGAETSFRGVGASGQKDNLGAMIGFAKGREEASRHPLDCFFGIPDPRKAQELLKSLMGRSSAREEEQTAYLRQICEKI